MKPAKGRRDFPIGFLTNDFQLCNSMDIMDPVLFSEFMDPSICPSNFPVRLADPRGSSPGT